MRHISPISRNLPARAQYEDIIGILSIIQVIISLPISIIQGFSEFLRVGGEFQNFSKAPSPPLF